MGLDGRGRGAGAARGKTTTGSRRDPRRMIDVPRARGETPGCEYVTHLNNAGASLPPQPVLDAVIGHLQLESRVGGYEAHEQNEAAIDRFYGAAAELIGAGPGEIAFASSATRAWDMAFYGFPFERGDRILTAVAEYISNYIAYIQVAERAGVEVVPSAERRARAGLGRRTSPARRRAGQADRDHARADQRLS